MITLSACCVVYSVGHWVACWGGVYGGVCDCCVQCYLMVLDDFESYVCTACEVVLPVLCMHDDACVGLEVQDLPQTWVYVSYMCLSIVINIAPYL